MAEVNANIDVNIDTSNALSQLKALQRQISQFHTSISKSSEAAALAQRDLQRNFINSVNSIGAFSAELRVVKSTAESFTDSLEKNKFSMREYFRYAGGATRTFGRFFRSEFDTINKVAEENVKRLQTQYIKMGRDASGAMRAIAIMPNQLDMSNVSTQLQMSAQRQAIFNQLLKQGSTNLLNFGKNTQWAGRQLMVGFTLPLATLGATASKTFMEMEAAALKFRKVYGDLFTPTEERQQAFNDITALGETFTKYGISVAQTVNLAADAAAAGFQGLDLQRQVTEATRLQVLGQIDQQKALETTISLQNAFKLSNEDLTESINFLNAVENQTVVSLDDITTAIPKVAPVIMQLGGDIKDLAFFMTAMKEGGVNASEGANALKSGLASLINPTEKASEMLGNMGINIRDIVQRNQGDLRATVVEFAQALDTLDPLARARAIEQLFGKFQFARLSTLFENVTTGGTQAARVLDLAGYSAEELAATAESELGMTAESSMNKFRAAVEQLKLALVPVGQVFLESVTPILEFIGGILEKFNGLSSGMKKAITVITVALGAIAPVALMTFGLISNFVANGIKGLMLLRNGYLRLTGQSQVLGEQTQYLTMEQQNALAVAHSLDQSHARLVQTFTVEAGAVQRLAQEYERAISAGARFSQTNPGMMRQPFLPGFADGILSVPGSGTGDKYPAMLAAGEAVIPARQNRKYAPLIAGIIADNIPGFQNGTSGYEGRIARGTQSINPFVSGHVAGFEPTQLPRTVEQLQQEMDQLGQSTNEQDMALKNLIEETLNSSIGIQNFGEVVDGVAVATARVIPILEIAEKNAAMISGGVGARLTGNARNEAFRQARISEPITFSQAQESVAGAMPIIKSGILPGGSPIQQKYLAELQHLVETTRQLSTQQEQAQFGISNMRKIIADQIASSNKNITQEELGNRVDSEMNSLTQRLVQTGAVEVDTKTGLITSMNDYKAALVFATQQLQTASKENIGAATTSVAGINQATRVAMRHTPSDLPVSLNRKSAEAKLIMPLKRTVAAAKTALQGEIPGLQAVGQQLGEAVINGISKGIASSSNSRKAIKEGDNVVGGLEQGMFEGMDDVSLAGQKLGDAAIDGVNQGTGGGSGGRGPGRRLGGGAGGAGGGGVAGGASANLAKFNSALMGVSFAMTSVSGIASAFGGRFQGLSEAVFKVSGLMFGLMSVVQLLTQEMFANVIANRANKVALAIDKTSGGFKGLFANATGFGSKLLTAGKFALRFAGGIGLALGAVTATISIIKRINAAREKERRAVMGLADASNLTANKLKTLGDFFGIKPTQNPMTQAVPQIRMTAERRGRVDELKANEGFQKDFGKDIETLKEASKKEAEVVLKSLALSLSGQGFAKDSIKDIIDALREEAGKTDVKIDFKLLDLGTKEGRKQFKALASDITDQLAVAAKNGYEEVEVLTQGVYENGAMYSYYRKELKPTIELQRAAEASGQQLFNMMTGLAGGLKNGAISAKEFNQGFNQLDAQFKALEESNPGQGILILQAAIKQLNPETQKLFEGLKKDTDILLMMRAQSLGLTSILPGLAEALKTINAGYQGNATELVQAQLNLEKYQNMLEASAKESEEWAKKVLGGTVSGDGEKSAFQKAIEQLTEQRKELNNTISAYGKLRKVGIDAGKAFEYAKDPIVAAALATTKVGTKKWKELLSLIEQVDKKSRRLALTELFDTRTEEINLKKQFAEIVPLLEKMGLEAEDIQDIISNPDLMRKFIKDLKDGVINSEKLQTYINEIPEQKRIDIILGITDAEDEFEKAKAKASELFDFLRRSAERKYKTKIIDAEKEVDSAQDAVDGVNKLIDKEQADIDTRQRNIEEKISRPIEDLQEGISKLQRQMELGLDRPIEELNKGIAAIERSIEEQFNRPIAVLQEESSDLANDLTLIDKAAEEINKKYDAQADALDKVAQANQEIINQQKQQIGLADALSRGDIAAAAQSIQEMRASSAAAAAGSTRDMLDAARKAELSGLRGAVSGLTRDQIEERQFQIGQQIFALEERREALQAQILNKQDQIFEIEKGRAAILSQIRDKEDQIFLLEEDRKKELLIIRGIEDKIFNIKKDQLTPAQEALDIAKENLDNLRDKLQAELDSIEAQEDAWEAEADAQFAAKVAAGEYNDVIEMTIGLLEQVEQKWKDIAAAAKAAASQCQLAGQTGVVVPKTQEQKAVDENTKKIQEQIQTLTDLRDTTEKGTAINFKLKEQIDELNYNLINPQTPDKIVDERTKFLAMQSAASAQLDAVVSKLGTVFQPVDTGYAGISGGMGFMRKGGFVKPKYMAMGGIARGTDKIPAMLSPGEFVVSRYAVDNYGVDRLKAINSGQYDGSSVYNYSVNVNVDGSSSDANDIARAVIKQIQQLDGQRIRRQAV